MAAAATDLSGNTLRIGGLDGAQVDRGPETSCSVREGAVAAVVAAAAVAIAGNC